MCFTLRALEEKRLRSEKRRAEAENARLAVIVNTSEDAIYSCTSEGVIVTWNPGAERMFGYTSEEITGKHFSILIPEELRSDLVGNLEKLSRGKALVHYEHENQRKDGSRFPVLLTISLIKDATGFITGGSVITRDITERKRAEEALRRANAYNRSLIEASLDPLATISVDGNITDVNAATEKVTGLSRAELIGTDFSNYFTDPDKARAGYLQVFRKGTVKDYELEIRHREGHITPVSYSASLYRDERGNILGVVAAARDMTERKRAEEALRDREERYRGLFDQMSSGVAVYRAIGDAEDFVFVEFNPAAEQIEHMGRESVIGKGVAEVFPGMKEFGLFSVFQRVWRTGEPEFFPATIYRDEHHPETWRENWVYQLTSGEIVAIYSDVTERKLAEAENARLALIVNSSQDAIFSITREGLIDTWNPRAEHSYGYTPGEITGKHMTTLIAESYRGLFPVNQEKLLRGGALIQFESEHVRKDGSTLPVLLTLSPLKDAQGLISGVSIISRDITARKRTEDALRESAARLNEAEHLAHIGSSNWEVATNTTTWSDELYRIMGRDPGEPGPTHQERAELYAPESWARLESAVQRALATGEPYDMELEVVRADGTHFPAHARGAAVRGDDGRIVRLHGTLQDITERKRAEADLALFKHSIDVHYDGAYWADADNRFIYFNDAGCKALGYEREELIGKTVFDISPGTSPESLKRLWEILRRQGFFAMEAVHRRKDGSEYPVDLVITYVQSGGKEFACGFARDITDRKRVEDALRESEAGLKVAQRIAGLGNWSMDLKTGQATWSDEVYRMVGADPSLPPPAYTEHGRLFTPGSWTRLTTAIEKTVRTGLPYELELETVRADGSRGWMLDRGEPVRDARGAITHLRGVAMDITERKRAELALMESEERFRTTFEHGGVGMVLADLQGHFVKSNPAFRHMLGYSEEELARMAFTEFTHPDDRDHDWGLFRELVEGKREKYETEKRYLRRDGSVMRGLLTGSMVRDGTAAPCMALGWSKTSLSASWPNWL